MNCCEAFTYNFIVEVDTFLYSQMCLTDIFSLYLISELCLGEKAFIEEVTVF